MLVIGKHFTVRIFISNSLSFVFSLYVILWIDLKLMLWSYWPILGDLFIVLILYMFCVCYACFEERRTNKGISFSMICLSELESA
jgi:hypothetical protein